MDTMTKADTFAREKKEASCGGFKASLPRRLAASGILMAVALPVQAQQETAEAVGAGIGLLLGLVIAIVIGAIVGWLAGLIVKGGGSGFWGNVLIGIGGSILASVVLPLFGISFGSAAGSLIAALVGAVILLLIVGAVRRGGK